MIHQTLCILKKKRHEFFVTFLLFYMTINVIFATHIINKILIKS